jgi:tetratricopeptide (TPR) repeat protein
MNRLTGWGRSGCAALVGVAVLSALVLSGPWARPAWGMQLSPQQKQEMKLHYERATRAYDVGKYQEAIEEYQKAYEIGGDPPMLYNIAQAYRLNDQPGEAIRFYRRYLQRKPDARNREDVERKVADLEKVVDERKKAAALATPPVVTAPPPTTTPATPPPATSNPPVVVAPPVTPPPGQEPQPESRARKIIAWTLMGVGVVAGGGAAYEAQVAKDKSDKVTAQSRSNPPIAFDPAVEQNGKTANVLAIVLGGVGAAAIITGVVLLITGGSSASPEAATTTARATVTPWVGGGVVGAGAELRF